MDVAILLVGALAGAGFTHLFQLYGTRREEARDVAMELVDARDLVWKERSDLEQRNLVAKLRLRALAIGASPSGIDSVGERLSECYSNRSLVEFDEGEGWYIGSEYLTALDDAMAAAAHELVTFGRLGRLAALTRPRDNGER